MLPLLIAARMPDLRRALVAWWGEKPLAQAILFLAVIGMFTLFGHNLSDNMQRLGLTPGFAFLGHAANFEIGEAPISYAAGDTYARAILVGVLNTIEVALAGCVLATILGVALGVARLSSNPLLSGLVQVYVEVVRNTPLLLQIFFWNTLSHDYAVSLWRVFLPTFWHGERPVAALATLIEPRKRTFSFYMTGRDETFEGPPAGVLLHAYSIRHAIERGFVALG